MLVIDNGDAIRGIAEVATKLDFIVNGYVGTTATQLADGQMASTEGNLYLSGADATVVTSITVVNTDSVARTFTLYLKPSGGTSRAITPVSLNLGIGYSLYTDGQRVIVMDALGNVLSTVTASAHALGSSTHTVDTLSNLNGKISDAILVDATAISSEIDGDISTHAGLADPHTGYRLESADHSHQTAGTQAGKIDHGAALNGLGDDDHTQYLLASGTRALAGAWNMGSQLITNLKFGGTVTLNGQVFDAGSGSAQINTTGAEAGLLIKSTDNAATGAQLFLQKFSTSPATGDTVGVIYGYGRDDESNNVFYSGIELQIESVDATGGHDGQITFKNISAGGWNDCVIISSLGLVWADVGFNADEYYRVAGTQVVSAQGAAVANPTDPASTQARLTDLLGRLRTHGLIAT